MDNIIKQIISIDEVAQKRLDEANRTIEEANASLAEQIKAVYQKIEEKTNERIQSVLETEQLASENRKRDIRNETDTAMKKLDEEFLSSHEKLENEIFSNVINI